MIKRKGAFCVTKLKNSGRILGNSHISSGNFSEFDQLK